MVGRETKASPALQDSQVLRETQGHLVLLEKSAYQVPSAPLAHPVHLVQSAGLEGRVLMETPVSLAAMETLASKVLLAPLDPRVTLVMKVLLVHLVMWGQREKRERRAHAVSKESADLRELVELLAQKVPMDHQVYRVLVDRVDPKVPVAHQAHEAPQARRERKDLPVLLAQRVQREIKERPATEVTQETGAHPDPLETSAIMGQLDLLGNEAPRVIRVHLVRLVLQGLQVWMAHKVLLAPRETTAHRAPLVFLVHLVLLAHQAHLGRTNSTLNQT